MTEIGWLLAAAVVIAIGVIGFKKSTGWMAVATIAFIALYVGSLFMGGMDGVQPHERGAYQPDNWSPFPNVWAPGPFIRSFMETGAIGELIAMPAIGILAVGFVMMLIWRDGASVMVFLVGAGLAVLASLTDAHNAGFDAQRHSPALMKFGLVAAAILGGLWLLIRKRKS